MRERHPAYFKNVWEKSKANLDGLATTKMTADGQNLISFGFALCDIPHGASPVASASLLLPPSDFKEKISCVIPKI